MVHFLLAGLAVFLFSAWRGEDVDPESRTITVTEAQVERLAAGWYQTWRRPPGPAEIDGLIRDFIREEIYYREARRLGLDQDDAVIRRRLRTKMEYLADAQVESARPDERTLQAWLDRHPARFAPDATISFDQIYLGQVGSDTAAKVLSTLLAGADWQRQGRAISLAKSFENVASGDIERQFGAGFAKQVAAVSLGGWRGPLESGFGLHLVRVRQRQTPSKAKLADVRQAVENDWRAATFKQRRAKAYQALLDGYDIRIEPK